MRRLLFILLLCLSCPAVAQFAGMAGPEPARTNAIHPELVLNGSAKPGAPAELAIVMHVRDGWHGYWVNPGEAGLPMSVEWQLPDGWAVEPLRYPVPVRLLVSNIVNYVYEKNYALLTRLKIPDRATGRQRIVAKMHWLACTEKICVPEQGQVELIVPVGEPAALDSRFDTWRTALPRALASEGHFAVADGTIRLAVPLPKAVSVSDPYFFPETENAVAYAAPQSFRRDGDQLIVEAKADESANPKSLDGVLAFGEGQGLEIHAVPGVVPSGGGPLGGRDWTGLSAALLGALLGGILLNLMPCVFPILAMKALHLARAGGDEGEARREALAYGTGAVVGTAALGAVLMLLRAAGSSAGWAFQLQDPRAILVLLLLATAIMLNLLKVFELPVLAGEANPAGSFATGALAAFVATPCSGPFMGAALGTALLLPIWGSVLVFAALGLGLAVPFLLLAFVPSLRSQLPSPGPWMAKLQRFLAVPMAATVAAALWLLYRLAGPAGLGVGLLLSVLLGLLLVGAGWRQAHGSRAVPMIVAGSLFFTVLGIALMPPARPAEVHNPPGTIVWNVAGVDRARANGKPVFVYFTADWCLTCKANEAGAIDRSDVQRAFRQAGVQTFVGDWTKGDAAIGRFLESQGRAGVPLYLWYSPAAQQPEQLPQILTPSLLVERARTSSAR